MLDKFLTTSSSDLPAAVQVQADLGKELPTLLRDKEQLERICQQLWQNAVEVIPEGGKLCWENALVQVTEPDSCVRDPYLRIRISDTGEGMDDTVKESMFEPFFTTKYGEDRGLGVTMVYDAVHAHQGFIEVSSEPLVGT